MGESLWTALSLASHVVGTIAAAALAGWFFGRRGRLGSVGLPLVIALSACAAWSIAAGALGTDSAGAAMIESFRNVACLLVLWRLFSSDGPSGLLKRVRPLLIVLIVVEVIQAAFLVALHRLVPGDDNNTPAFVAIVGLRLIFTIGALVLTHNLYTGATQRSRLALRWPAGGLALLWVFDLNLYTVAYLAQDWPSSLAALRGFALAGACAILLPLGAERRDDLHIQPSRTFAFQFAALAVIGAYLAIMIAMTRGLKYVGGDYATVVQFGVLIVASLLALLALPSRRLRAWIKVTLVKHLFRHRYDYRAEWLRFAQTIGRPGETAQTLEERAVQSLAQITDSPAGLLLTPGEHGDLELSGRWQWPAPEVPACAMNIASIRFFERTGFIAEIDSIRAGECQHGEAIVVPAWLLSEPCAWAVVPLIHYGMMTGVIVLARPEHSRKLDWEDFDLLRVVGQQLATTLSENANHDALTEAARFDEFHRRIAFVMHDIKNLASQFGLLARNAELHSENPAFRADMLVTLRNSADKLNTLIARLSRYGAGVGDAVAEIDVCDVLRQVAEHFGSSGQVSISACQGATIIGNRDALEQALIHLVQNALDASPQGAPVFIGQSTDGLHANIEIIDSGHGMSPDFVRTRLFKPFVSSKQGGFGIGAFEARELIRAMKGRLDVESREGLGSRFIVRLPLASTAELISNYEHRAKKVA